MQTKGMSPLILLVLIQSFHIDNTYGAGSPECFCMVSNPPVEPQVKNVETNPTGAAIFRAKPV